MPSLVQEIYGGEVYEYYPLGQYIVSAPGVCGGRPTFKYTRLDVSMILAQISTGRTIEELVQAYDIDSVTVDAIREAIVLSGQSLIEMTTMIGNHQPALTAL